MAMSRISGWCLCGLLSLTATARGERWLTQEAADDARVFEVSASVKTQGKLMTQAGGGQTRDLPIESTAQFAFRERRLPPAGRDSAAFRAAREFSIARMQARIEGEQTALELPASSRMIVTSGGPQGLQCYAVRSRLTRDLVDLLSLPADPLALAAVLPAAPVGVGEEWVVPEWSAQLLAGIEAVESARLTGRVVSIQDGVLTLALTGAVQGLQEGAKTTVNLDAQLSYDTAGQHLARGSITTRIQAEIGAVSPGIDATVAVNITRRPAQQPGGLTEAWLQSIPLDTPVDALRLEFEAAPWNVRLRHDRGWYVFHAVFDAPPKVVILRLVEHGSLVCQCNFSPIPDAPPGQHTPLGEYEQDIRNVLGKAFRSITRQEVTSLPGGRTLIEVFARGEVEVSGKSKDGTPTTLAIPMEWRYYIVADERGRQMSFVFALEQALVEQLADRDRVLVTSLEFLGPR